MVGIALAFRRLQERGECPHDRIKRVLPAQLRSRRSVSTTDFAAADCSS